MSFRDESRKIQRLYKDIRISEVRLLSPRTHFHLIPLEISYSGFTGSTKSFEQFLRSKDLNAERIIRKCQEVARRASYFIYCRQYNTWSEPDLI